MKQPTLSDTSSVRRKRGRPKVVKVDVKCVSCGTHLTKYPSQVAVSRTKQFLCGPCLTAARMAGLRKRTRTLVELDRLHNGRRPRLDQGGYVRVYEPSHHRARLASGKKKNWQPEHCIVVEIVMGRPLKHGEVVHHINSDKVDNRPENLVVMSRQEHTRLHEAERTEQLQRLKEYERRYGPLEPGADSSLHGVIPLLFKRLTVSDLLSLKES